MGAFSTPEDRTLTTRQEEILAHIEALRKLQDDIADEQLTLSAEFADLAEKLKKTFEEISAGTNASKQITETILGLNNGLHSIAQKDSEHIQLGRADVTDLLG